MRKVLFALTFAALEVLLTVALVSLEPVLSAQAPNIVSYTQRVYAQGATTPTWTNTYQATSVTCNIPAPTGWPNLSPAPVTNPTQVLFDDAAHAGMICQITIASTLLPALPNGTGYTSTLTQTDTLNQTSAESASTNPFGKQGAPPTLTNVRVK